MVVRERNYFTAKTNKMLENIRSKRVISSHEMCIKWLLLRILTNEHTNDSLSLSYSHTHSGINVVLNILVSYSRSSDSLFYNKHIVYCLKRNYDSITTKQQHVYTCIQVLRSVNPKSCSSICYCFAIVVDT